MSQPDPFRLALRSRLAAVLLVAAALVAVIGAAVPAPVIGWLRIHIPGFALVSTALSAPVPWFNPLHLVVFAVLALWWRLLAPRLPWWRIPLVLTVLGILMEALQHFVPSREPRLRDVSCDVAGIALGLGLAWLLRRWRTRRQGAAELCAARHTE